MLVVEDEPFIADELCLQLSELGYNVVGQSESGESALKTALQHRPNVILLDVELAGELDGIETAHLASAVKRVHIGVLGEENDHRLQFAP